MIDYVTPIPFKDLVHACQAMMHWHDEYAAEQTWVALKNETNFRERIRELVPQCIELLKHYPLQVDSE